MSDITNRTAVDGLDFYEIKAKLRDFLSSQDKFKDYNFEGSGLSILLDLLAYNTHYINYYSNMVANEMFLDTATTRDSVVSHAKLLGYTPNSNRAARAKVSLIVGVDEESGRVPEFLPKNSGFASIPGQGSSASVTFLTNESHKFEPYEYDDSGNILRYWIPEIEIIEGTAKVTTYVVDRTNRPAQRFIIPQGNVDISTLKVRVQSSATDISGYDEYWTLVTDPLQLNAESKVYFIQETENQKFEIYFGDDIVGKSVKNGNIVVLEYIVTSSDPTAANGIGSTDSAATRSFIIESGGSLPLGDREVIVISPAAGGAERETINSIKYYAPRGFQAQDRAVTVEDYSFMLAKEYPFAESIYVWGGEDNNPPIYGKVFISIKPLRGTNLTNQEKEAIKFGILKKFNIVGVTPEIIDPDYTYLKIDTTVKMNQSKSAKTPNDVKQIVKDTINQYINDNLGKFGGNLLSSRLYSVIDTSCPSIEASATKILLEKRIEPNYGVLANYTTNFSNPIEPGTVQTNAFLHFDPAKVGAAEPYSIAYIRDAGDGTLNVISFESVPGTAQRQEVEFNPEQLEEKSFRILKPNAGTINYSTGKLDMPGLNIAGMSGVNPVLRITTQPSNFAEIIADRNQLLVVDSEDPTSIGVAIRLSSQGRLNSPVGIKNQPSFQQSPTASAVSSTVATTQPPNVAEKPPQNRSCVTNQLSSNGSNQPRTC